MTLILTAHDIYYYYLIGSRVIYIYKLSISFLLSLIRNQFEDVQNSAYYLPDE
jgi:hypothetical protein